MFRLAIAMIIGGGIFTYFNTREFLLDRRAKAEPEAIDLAKLEAGDTPDNPHLRIGKHFAVFAAGVYEYRKGKNDVGVTPNTKITKYFYPVISAEHPFFKELAELAKQHGGLDNVPDDASWPQINSFRVLVKTTRFPTVGAIPDDIRDVDSISGVVINSIDPLDKETRNLLLTQFRGADLENVLVLEDGRKPAGLAWGLAKVILPLAIALAGVFMLIPRRSDRVPESSQDILSSENPYAATDAPQPPGLSHEPPADGTS